MGNWLKEMAFQRKVASKHKILSALCGAGDNVTVGEVERRTELAKSYCHKLLKEMVAEGLVVREETSYPFMTRQMVFYRTAYDAIGLGIPNEVNLPGDEIEFMAETWDKGISAAQWYGYEEGWERLPWVGVNEIER